MSEIISPKSMFEDSKNLSSPINSREVFLTVLKNEEKYKEEIKDNYMEFIINEKSEFANIEKITQFYEEKLINKYDIYDKNLVIIKKKKIELEAVSNKLNEEILDNFRTNLIGVENYFDRLIKEIKSNIESKTLELHNYNEIFNDEYKRNYNLRRKWEVECEYSKTNDNQLDNYNILNDIGKSKVKKQENMLRHLTKFLIRFRKRNEKEILRKKSLLEKHERELNELKKDCQELNDEILELRNSNIQMKKMLESSKFDLKGIIEDNKNLTKNIIKLNYKILAIFKTFDIDTIGSILKKFNEESKRNNSCSLKIINLSKQNSALTGELNKYISEIKAVYEKLDIIEEHGNLIICNKDKEIDTEKMIKYEEEGKLLEEEIKSKKKTVFYECNDIKKKLAKSGNIMNSAINFLLENSNKLNRAFKLKFNSIRCSTIHFSSKKISDKFKKYFSGNRRSININYFNLDINKNFVSFIFYLFGGFLFSLTKHCIYEFDRKCIYITNDERKTISKSDDGVDIDSLITAYDENKLKINNKKSYSKRSSRKQVDKQVNRQINGEKIMLGNNLSINLVNHQIIVSALKERINNKNREKSARIKPYQESDKNYLLHTKVKKASKDSTYTKIDNNSYSISNDNYKRSCGNNSIRKHSSISKYSNFNNKSYLEEKSTRMMKNSKYKFTKNLHTNSLNSLNPLSSSSSVNGNLTLNFYNTKNVNDISSKFIMSRKDFLSSILTNLRKNIKNFDEKGNSIFNKLKNNLLDYTNELVNDRKEKMEKEKEKKKKIRMTTIRIKKMEEEKEIEKMKKMLMGNSTSHLSHYPRVLTNSHSQVTIRNLKFQKNIIQKASNQLFNSFRKTLESYSSDSSESNSSKNANKSESEDLTCYLFNLNYLNKKNQNEFKKMGDSKNNIINKSIYSNHNHKSNLNLSHVKSDRMDKTYTNLHPNPDIGKALSRMTDLMNLKRELQGKEKNISLVDLYVKLGKEKKPIRKKK